MSKRILVIGMALALGGLSTASFAADGNFYIGVGVGQAKWHLGGDTSDVKFDDTDTTANLRFGYVWHGNVDFAVEGGYIDLGKLSSDWADKYDQVHTSAKSQGLFAGVKVKYHFAGGWYVGARGGLYEGRIKQDGNESYAKSSDYWVSDTFSDDETHTGEYAGVGLGYDFGRHFGLGLEYNYYHNKFFDTTVNFGTATVAAEYRF